MGDLQYDVSDAMKDDVTHGGKTLYDVEQTSNDRMWRMFASRSSGTVTYTAEGGTGKTNLDAVMALHFAEGSIDWENIDDTDGVIRAMSAEEFAEWDSEKHPRWPEGAPGGLGGKFAPSEQSIEPEAKTWAAKVRAEAKGSQGKVHDDLVTIARRNGCEMQGLKWELKSEGSLAEKISRKMDVAHGVTAEDAALAITDELRYTAILPTDQIPEKFAAMKADLEGRGYEFIQTVNTLDQHGVPYRGINCDVMTPNAHVFELQFHTAESFETKEVVNHPLYEASRKLDKGTDAYARITAEMAVNADRVPDYRGVSGIIDLRPDLKPYQIEAMVRRERRGL
jgi:hypothetical protein